MEEDLEQVPVALDVLSASSNGKPYIRFANSCATRKVVMDQEAGIGRERIRRERGPQAVKGKGRIRAPSSTAATPPSAKIDILELLCHRLRIGLDLTASIGETALVE